MINTPVSRSFAGAVIHFGLLPWEPPHTQEGRLIVTRLLIKTLRIRKVMKRMGFSVCMRKGRQLLL